MKHPDVYTKRRQGQVRFWGPLLALPFTGILLATIPPDLRSWMANVGDPRLEAPYRYQFSQLSRDSAAGSLAIEREIAFYQKRIARSPQDGLDLATLASAYLKMARLTGVSSWYLLAEQAARRSLVNLPFSNQGAILVLARIAEAKHDFTEAIRLAQQVQQTQPADGDALALLVTSNLAIGQVDKAAEEAALLVNRFPTVGTLTLRAQVKVAQGQDQAALQDFQQALKLEEAGDAFGSAWVRTLLGRFHAQRGNLTLAGQLYREALRTLPQYPLALMNLAELETRLANYRTAERYYADLLGLAQDSTAQVFDHVVLRGRARLESLQGDRSEAIQLQNQAEAKLRQHLNLNSFGHRRELARLLLEQGNSRNVAEALALMQAEVRLRRDPETYDTLAWALSRSGRWREAQQAMREALRWGTRDAGMYYRAGTIEQALGDQAQARTYFQSARSTDPTFDEQAQRSLGLGLELKPN